MKKKCFLICPIGKENTDIRNNSDDLMELIIEPALEKYEFDVIRADKISRSSIITADIVQMVQNAELCIIDLTGNNPNVFYECGRRHETGKPFIQLIQKGEVNNIPFDVAGIRTIEYDLSSVRLAHKAVKEIREYVSDISASGFEIKSGTESLTSIASVLQRVERKVDKLSENKGKYNSNGMKRRGLSEQLRLEANPKTAFIKAIFAEDLTEVRAALKLCHDKYGNTIEVLENASLIAEDGDMLAADICISILKEPSEILDFANFKNGMSSLIEYYRVTDKEIEGIPIMIPIFDKELNDDSCDNDEKAWLFSQIYKLYAGAKMYEKALIYAEKSVELEPCNTKYVVNLAVAFSELGMKEKAVESTDKFIELIDIDEYINKGGTTEILMASARYANCGRPGDAIKLFEKAYKRSPRQSRLLCKMQKELNELVKDIVS